MKIGFIGAGRMAQALGAGISKLPGSNELFISDPSEDSQNRFREIVGAVSVVPNNKQLFQASDIVLLAVKPQVANDALNGLSVTDVEAALTISIMSGWTLERLAGKLGYGRIIRVMPNTPCLIGKGIMGMSVGSNVSNDDISTATSLMSSVGTVLTVAENYLDGVTGLSGSGPAFVYTFVEALIDAGVGVGLHRDIARQLALETVIGSAEMIRKTGLHPAELRDQVTSPGGTTIAGMQALEENGFRDAINCAVQASTRRSIELGD